MNFHPRSSRGNEALIFLLLLLALGLSWTARGQGSGAGSYGSVGSGGVLVPNNYATSPLLPPTNQSKLYGVTLTAVNPMGGYADQTFFRNIETLLWPTFQFILQTNTYYFQSGSLQGYPFLAAGIYGGPLFSPPSGGMQTNTYVGDTFPSYLAIRDIYPFPAMWNLATNYAQSVNPSSGTLQDMVLTNSQFGGSFAVATNNSGQALGYVYMFDVLWRISGSPAVWDNFGPTITNLMGVNLTNGMLAVSNHLVFAYGTNDLNTLGPQTDDAFLEFEFQGGTNGGDYFTVGSVFRYEALQETVEMALGGGKPTDAQAWANEASITKSNFNAILFDPAAGLCWAGTSGLHKYHSLHASLKAARIGLLYNTNALAVYTNVVKHFSDGTYFTSAGWVWSCPTNETPPPDGVGVLQVSGAGSAVNGGYGWVNPTQWTGAGSTTCKLSGGTWTLAIGATSEYTCPAASFPGGPWTITGGLPSAPTASIQNNYIQYTTTNHVIEALDLGWCLEQCRPDLARQYWLMWASNVVATGVNDEFNNALWRSPNFMVPFNHIREKAGDFSPTPVFSQPLPYQINLGGPLTISNFLDSAHGGNGVAGDATLSGKETIMTGSGAWSQLRIFQPGNGECSIMMGINSTWYPGANTEGDIGTGASATALAPPVSPGTHSIGNRQNIFVFGVHSGGANSTQFAINPLPDAINGTPAFILDASDDTLKIKGGIKTVGGLGVGTTIVPANGNVTVAGSVTTTNGHAYYQVSSIPTNYVPPGISGQTNWLQCNTNGIMILVATNFNNVPSGQAWFVKQLAP